MTTSTRRRFLRSLAALGAGLTVTSTRRATAAPTKSTQTEPEGYFTIGRRKDHWWLITPDGEPFFSMGLNHIDPATLRYPENVDLWRERYRGSTIRWIKESVAPNLKAWGFNTVGWVQEVTVRKWRHSRAFTVDEYRAGEAHGPLRFPERRLEGVVRLRGPLPLRGIGRGAEPDRLLLQRLPDVDALPTGQCLAGTNLRPRSIEDRGGPPGTDRARNELLTNHARRHPAVRPHHLLLGDRYDAAKPFVDVLSFQDFRNPVTHLKEWHEKTGKLVLLADAARIKWQTRPGEFTPNDGQWYAETLAKLFENPGCVGFHLCGAYQRNKARRYGLLDEREQPDEENVARIRAANNAVARLLDEDD